MIRVVVQLNHLESDVNDPRSSYVKGYHVMYVVGLGRMCPPSVKFTDDPPPSNYEIGIPMWCVR